MPPTPAYYCFIFTIETFRLIRVMVMVIEEGSVVT